MNKYRWKKFPIEYNKLCICIVCNTSECAKCNNTLKYIQSLCATDATLIVSLENISWDDHLKNYKDIQQSGQFIVYGNDKTMNTYFFF